ncbi:hypothetical protein [Ruegeria sp. EL01]|uniref:hypothetical protein n=1 Tax=Ruegeria sp. EL01 TaxID=2107578 RepID=UPI0013C45260|nr:hypothetical protein [Ruegeria sp. EL01]
METAAPVFWGGMLVLFLLLLHRTGWNVRESILAIVGLRGMRNITPAEIVVMAVTFCATFYVMFQAIEACKQI